MSYPWMRAAACGFAAFACLGLPAAAAAQEATNGGASPEAPAGEPAPAEERAPVGKARLSRDGRKAIAPADAPPEVKRAIAYANRITRKPYRYGGGHASFRDSAYDCSGTVSYALRGARLVRSPLDSTGFMSWGENGKGRWITVYANRGHAYVVIAGLRFDTSGRGEKGPRWRREARSSRGYRVRHWPGL